MPAEAAPGAGPQATTSMWSNRDFVLIWGAQTVCDLGSGMTTLAYPS